MDEAEDDVVHRAAVGDGEREREEGDVPLGVQRAVDRVDDDPPGLAGAEDPLAELLGDEREVLVERSSRCTTAVSAAASIAVVSSPPSPCAEDRLALDAGRQLREHAP